MVSEESLLLASMVKIIGDGRRRLMLMVDDLKVVLREHSLSLPLKGKAHSTVLVGGGSGTPTVARALQTLGATPFTMLANTGETQEDNRGNVVGAGLVRRTFNTIDWIDIVKQSLYGRRAGDWTGTHRLLDHRLDQWMRFGYLAFEAAKQVWGLQFAINFWNYQMRNPYRVMPTVDQPCGIMFQVGSGEYSFYEYAGRSGDLRLATKVYLEPKAMITSEVDRVLGRAKVAIIGPGDVHFSVLFHFAVKGFLAALARVPKIILVANLTARPMDIPNFTLRQFLDLYARYLPSGKEIIVLAHQGEVAADNPLRDDIQGSSYGNFQIVRANLASARHSHNQQLIHDEDLLAQTLKPLIQ